MIKTLGWIRNEVEGGYRGSEGLQIFNGKELV